MTFLQILGYRHYRHITHVFTLKFNYIVIVLYYTGYTVIQFIQLCSLYSYTFKQMSVERPSTARLLEPRSLWIKPTYWEF